MKTQLRMIRGDITLTEADAIVNSANNDLVLGGGVSGTISRVAGPEVQEECHKIGTIPLGTAVVTAAGNLRATHIIHAAVNPLGLWADVKSVRNATKNTLARAEELKVKRLAFPAIGTGAGALPVARCAEILIDEVTRHCSGETCLEEVMFVLYDEKPYLIFEERFKEKVKDESAVLPLPSGAPPPESAKEGPEPDSAPAPDPPSESSEARGPTRAEEEPSEAPSHGIAKEGQAPESAKEEPPPAPAS